jgi:ribosomal protein L12E/L44/L45/RPP1/RPP2
MRSGQKRVASKASRSRSSQAEINALVKLRSETLAAIILGMTNNISRLLLLALDQLMVDDRVRGDLDGMMPYVYTAGFLALSGQDLTKERMETALKTVGVESNKERLSKFLSTNTKADLVYMYAAYYLIVMGTPITKENIENILVVLGHRVDEDSVNKMLVMYKEGLIP